MDSEEILKQAELTVLSVVKSASKSKDKTIKGVHDLYADSVEMVKHISYHAVKGNFPKELFIDRSPNQTEKESIYIEKNYKQYTLPEYMDYLNTICRPFGDGNWSIDYKDEEQKYIDSELTFQSYVEYELPIYGSLENFIKSILPNLKSIDANGFIAVRPKEIEYKLNENEEEVISDSLLEPTVFYFKSDSVIDYKEDEYYLFLSNEKSLVTHNDKKVKEGLIFELYTENEVYFIKQIGKKSDNDFETEKFYSHDYDECPVAQLKGVPDLKGEYILWQSPFLFGVDLLDLIAVNSNWLQFSVNKCVFPMTVMYGSPCEFKDEHGGMCDNGIIHGISNDIGYERTCPACNGSGLKGRLSPLGTLLIKPTTEFKEGETGSTQPPLSYVSPDVTTLEFIEKKIDKDTIKARQILKLRNRNSAVTGKEITATEIYDDAKGMTAFIKPIIDQIFSLYEFCLYHIGKQRYGEDFKEPELIYPKSFDFKSAEDYLIDLTNAIKGNLPPAIIQTLLLQYINAYYGDNQKATAIFKIAMKADRLCGLSQDEINMKLSKGTIAKWEDILHTSVLTFINESILADDKFVEKPIDEQVEIVRQLAKDSETAISGSTATQIYGTLAGVGGGDSELGKLPLALQQLALARTRAEDSNDKALAKRIGDKMDDLLKQI